jgi:uracil-DNA glycosylase
MSSDVVAAPRNAATRFAVSSGCWAPSVRVRAVIIEEIIAALAAARIGDTFNQYSCSRLRRERLGNYLAARRSAPILLVGEAAGYRGARVSGVPFTSERQLTGRGPAEATATIVHCVLAELGLEEDVLLWNVVPTHPGTERSNRRPTRAEVEAGRPFLERVAAGRRTIAVGRVAHAVLGGDYVRHPSHGGAAEFRRGLLERCAKPSPGRATSATRLLPCPAGGRLSAVSVR